jgi:long-chain acyl-CoA synthetase
MKIGNFTEMIESSIRNHWELKSMSLFQGDGYTYEEVGEKILQLHKLFELSGIKSGDKISLIGTNDYNWCSVYLATVTYGAVIVPILQDFHPNDIVNVIEQSDSRMLFVSDHIYKKINTKSFSHIEGVISLDTLCVVDAVDKTLNDIVKESLHTDIEVNKETFRLPKNSNDQIAVISYTSGTSGFSRGVMLPHMSLAANVQFALDFIDLKPKDTIVSFLPLAHAYACAFEFLSTFTMGCDITFLGKVPSPTIILQAFKEVKPRLIFVVPLIIEKIYRSKIQPKISKGIIKHLIKIPLINILVYSKINKELTTAFGNNFMEVIIGGAALNSEVEKFLKKIKFRYTVGYGMTECGPLISYAPWRKVRTYSCGKAIPCVTIKIDSPDPENIVGEILVKGDNVMKGYYKNEEITEATISPDGWLYTGDLGIVDKDGYLFIKGRSKNMILSSSGQNVYPEEIEAKSNNLPYVLESLVVEKDGKLVALIVVDRDAVKAAGITEDKLKAIMEQNHKHLNSHLPNYMNVSKFIIHDGEFEKTAKRSIKRFMYDATNA